MGMVPKLRRDGPADYRVVAGDYTVRVRWLARTGKWIAKPLAYPVVPHVFDTRDEAVTWAIDWLNEHA